MENRIQCDVLVIGSGAAGIRAAIEASDCGADVMIVTKMEYGYSGSSFYANSIPWGMMMAGEGEEEERIFLDEILRASSGCLDKKLTEILVRDSNQRLKDLLSYGIEFRMSEGAPCFGKKPRGAMLISMDNARRCFKKQIEKRNIRVIENFSIYDLIVKDFTCYGAVGIDPLGNFIMVDAKTVIMASGGAENLWKYGFALQDMTGDAYAMAARNGARLVNLEFIQFIPGVVSPLSRTNFYHPTLKSLPAVYNIRGEEFLEKYLPEGVTVERCLETRAGHGPFSCDDDSKYFDMAIYMEEAANHEGDIAGAEIRYTEAYYNDSRYKEWNDFLTSAGVDTKSDQLRIYPHCQGFNGGLFIDEHCSTDIENLYACGECAGGPHGANRIGGNAVLGTQVFGKIAGEQAALKSKIIRNRINADVNDLHKLEDSSDNGYTSKLRPEEVMEHIRAVMQESAFIVREEKKLKKGIEKIEKIQTEYNPHQYLKDGNNAGRALNAYNSLLTSRLILYSMLNRRESRGGHYRSDFPHQNNEFFGGMSFVRMDEDRNVFIEQSRELYGG